MPNICSAIIYARGRKDSIDEFIKILQSDYRYGYNEQDVPYVSHVPHFFRIFKADVVDRYTISGLVDFCSIDIECAWSVSACMFPGPFSYYDNFVKDKMPKFYSNIIAESKRLQIEIEIFSAEPGMGFQEQYRLVSGIVTVNKEYPYTEYWLDGYNSLKEMQKDYADIGVHQLPIKTEEEFQRLKLEDPVYEVDRIDDSPSISSEPKYLAKLVMAKIIENKGE